MILIDILSTDADISTWYRSSNTPIIVRDFLAKRKRKKLYQIVMRFTDPDEIKYKTEDIYQLFNYIYSTIENPHEEIEEIDRIARVDQKDDSPMYNVTLVYDTVNRVNGYRFDMSIFPNNTMIVSAQFSKLDSVTMAYVTSLDYNQTDDPKYKLAKEYINTLVASITANILTRQIELSEEKTTEFGRMEKNGRKTRHKRE